MELLIHFTTLPEGMDTEKLNIELTTLLDGDGWFTGAHQGPEGGYMEMELEDEKINPKYGILTVKNYLKNAKFAPETTIELAGTPVGIYE